MKKQLKKMIVVGFLLQHSLFVPVGSAAGGSAGYACTSPGVGNNVSSAHILQFKVNSISGSLVEFKITKIDGSAFSTSSDTGYNALKIKEGGYTGTVRADKSTAYSYSVSSDSKIVTIKMQANYFTSGSQSFYVTTASYPDSFHAGAIVITAVNIVVTNPDAGTYQKGQTVSVEWTPVGTSASDSMTISMKRNSYTGSTEGPNYYRFTTSTLNDRQYNATIPSSVEAATDWTFNIGHNSSGAVGWSDPVTVTVPIPTITSVSPDTVSSGVNNGWFNVYGSGFSGLPSGYPIVWVGGFDFVPNPAKATVVSDSHIQIQFEEVFDKINDNGVIRDNVSPDLSVRYGSGAQQTIPKSASHQPGQPFAESVQAVSHRWAYRS